MGRIAILWHLHQPDYRVPGTGRPFMPWVRMHALRGYRDLLVETAETGARYTLNVVPSLLDQLAWYAGGGDDDHLVHTRAPADAIDPALVRALPSGHPAMTATHPAYQELRARSDAGEPLTVGEIRDLQVWATLAWFGATALRDFPVLRRMISRGRGFGETDKIAMLAVQDAILRDLPARIAPAAAAGATISTSPYYHPILPLLVDVSSARRAMPELPDDLAFVFPDDARRQLVDARARTGELAGRIPVGLWPSEGSVSPEVVALAGEAGYRWLATDAQILARSDRDRPVAPGGWDLGSAVIGFFRDTDLSDRIGFRYAQRPADEAVAELVGLARERAGRSTLLVALDGENPWESYADAGAELRRRLVEGLGADLVGLDEAAEERPVGRVSRLHTGSWIGANFKIWAGHPEDRAAWRALARVRAAAEQAPEDRRAAALRHILPAEGSDWFWWYGDEFETVWADKFDALFRTHLTAAWHALGAEPPPELASPIREPRLLGGSTPTRFLTVDPDAPGGLVGWAGAGEVRFAEGSMAADNAVLRVRYGWTRGEGGRAASLWVRIECRGEGWRLEPAPDRVERLPDGFCACYLGGVAPLVLVAPDGDRWPEVPVPLEPPAHPSLRWWVV